MPDLTPKAARFVDEYRVGRDGKRAAIRAGYAPSCASTVASQLLKTPAVREALQKAQADRAALALSRERVLGELASIAFGAEAQEASRAERLKALAQLARLIGPWRPGYEAPGAAHREETPFERIIVDPAKA